MKPLFHDYTDSELISTRKSLKDTINRRKWLPKMKAIFCQTLMRLELVMEERKVRA